jgi:hypothetical protein
MPEDSLTTKKCCSCKLEFLLDKFYKDSSRSDGLSNKCKSCSYIKYRKYKETNPDVIKAEKRRYYARNKDKLRQYYCDNKEQILAAAKQNRTGKNGYLKTMLNSAKSRAKQKGWDFDLELDHLMAIASDCCPVDGLPFDWDRQLESDRTLLLAIPSLDRIDSSRGYTKDNVIIIGDKWNRWKSNMNLAELELLTQYVRSATKG